MGRKKGTRVEVVYPNPLPQLPSKFINLIKDSDLAMGKVVSDEIFVIQKQLTDSDVNLKNNRFTIPLRQVLNNFLTETEEETLQIRKKKGKLEKIPVMLVEPRCEINSVDLMRRSMNNGKKKKKKKKKKKSAKESVSYILTTRWTLVLKDEENKLKAGETVGVWAVRVEKDLWLVLVRLPEGQGGEGTNSDDAAGRRNDHLKLTGPPPTPLDFINFRNKSHVSLNDYPF